MRKTKEINTNILYDWIKDFRNKNGFLPRVCDLSEGPYNRYVIEKKYGNLTKLYELIGYRRETNVCIETNEELLEMLREYVIRYRTTDRDILRNNGLHDRSVYEKRFGSWSKALKLSGIDNRIKVLIKYFDNYAGEDVIIFLKNTLGRNGDFNAFQYELIKSAKKVNCDPKKIRNTINYKYLKKHFMQVSILIIACGEEPRVTYCSGNTYKAIDGHICDSGKEVEVDNFLNDNDIPHDVHVKYPNSEYICDFKINDLYVEYAGLMDKTNYSNKILDKIKYANENNIKQLVIYDTKKESLKQIVKAALSSDI